MKRVYALLLLCLTALQLSAATEVTIDARDLKLYEETAGFPIYILRMEASGNTAAIRIQIHATAEDYTGSYSIGDENSALVLPAGAATSAATQATGGTIIVSRPAGEVVVTGSIVCANGVTYKLNLRLDPQPTRTASLTINTLTIEDRTISEQEFQIYGYNTDQSVYVQLTVFATMIEGTFTSADLYKPYSYIRLSKDGSTVYHDVLTAQFTTRKSGERIAVNGTLICQNESDAKDIIEYTIAFSCVRDKKDQPMAGDATDADFEAFFDDYWLDTNEQALNGDIFVYANNPKGQCVALDVYIAEGETEITAGIYPILQGTDLSNPYMSVHASEGVISGFTTPSYAGYVNMDVDLIYPVWYIMAGTVVIDAEGRIEVNAINSAERTIHCVLKGVPEAVETTTIGMESRKILRDGKLLIRRGEHLYSLQGVLVE